MLQHSALDHIANAGRRIAGGTPAAAERCAVIGAGTMGAGIAIALSRAGIRVELADVVAQAREQAGATPSRRIIRNAR